MKEQNSETGQIEVEITDLSDKGSGIGRVGGQIVFVDGKNLVPGDLVTAQITKQKKNYILADLLWTNEPSPHRREGFCVYSEAEEGACGGCAYAGMSYDAQLALKQRQVAEKLEHIGGLASPKVNEIIGMSEPYNYRNKATMPISTGGVITRKGGVLENLGEVAIGFRKARSHEVVDCISCQLQAPAAMAAALATRRFMTEDDITAFDEKWNKGLMRSMTVRSAFATGEVMVIYEINGKGIPGVSKLIEYLDDAVFDAGFSLESVVTYDGKKHITIAGKNVIGEQIGDTKFEISPTSFYQVNPAMTEALYGKVLEYADIKGYENILDLYCGVGAIGLTCGQSAGFVLGIESVKEAVVDANRNAVINGAVNARFICGKAEEVLPELAEGKNEKYDSQLLEAAGNADIVILDPPRKGCSPKLLEAVRSIAPQKIIYVSCDPATLARDIKILTQDAGNNDNYEFIEATPVDMFPHTTHVESVVLMSKVQK